MVAIPRIIPTEICLRQMTKKEFRELREISGSIITNPLISLNSLNSLEITLY
jgi:hypothetical protein